MRRPNLGGAGADLVFVVLTLALGVGGAPWPYAALAFAGAVVGWAWTRWAALSRMAPGRLFSSVAVSLGVLAGVLGVAYWTGLLLGGHA